MAEDCSGTGIAASSQPTAAGDIEEEYAPFQQRGVSSPFLAVNRVAVVTSGRNNHRWAVGAMALVLIAGALAVSAIEVPNEHPSSTPRAKQIVAAQSKAASAWHGPDPDTTSRVQAFSTAADTLKLSSSSIRTASKEPIPQHEFRSQKTAKLLKIASGETRTPKHAVQPKLRYRYSRNMRLFCQRAGRSTPECRIFRHTAKQS